MSSGSVSYTHLEIVPLLIKGELDMAAIPANLAATLYQKTEGGIQAEMCIRDSTAANSRWQESLPVPPPAHCAVCRRRLAQSIRDLRTEKQIFLWNIVPAKMMEVSAGYRKQFL